MPKDLGLDCERIVISAMLNGQTFDLPAEAFEDGICREIYKAIGRGAEDLAVIAKKAGLPFSTLTEMYNEYTEGIKIDVHAGIMLDAYHTRKFSTELRNVITSLESGQITLKDAKVKFELMDVPTPIENRIFTAADQIDKLKSKYVALKKNRFVTGIDAIDEKIRGVSGGEVLTILGRAGCFKTAMLQNFLKNYTSMAGIGALFFSIEMPTASVAERQMAISMRWNTGQVETAFAGLQGEQTTHAEEKYLRDYEKLYVVEHQISLREIPEYVRVTERKHGPVGLIGIDYLGLVSGDGKSEYERVSEIARDVKTLAKKLDRPVILLSQVNRTAGDGSQEVFLHQGRGSGAIEEAADYVLAGWQDEEDVVFKIAKNRRGPKGDCFVVSIEKTTFRLGSVSYPWEPPKTQRREML